MRPTPDLAEAIVGWRAWKLDTRGSLVSLSRHDVWPVGQPLVARCDRARHEAPSQECTCGIYAFRSECSAPRGMAVGKVKLWGRVVAHERGYRAEFARPLSTNDEKVSARYGIAYEPKPPSPGGRSTGVLAGGALLVAAVPIVVAVAKLGFGLLMLGGLVASLSASSRPLGPRNLNKG
jgi:hypothetical protein